ncbi:MAG: flavin reductase family protein [Candidatus Thorarchaeota archaeon]|nr:flavin reductase family protein [Candidatus Thorarchaeota archaeon]
MKKEIRPTTAIVPCPVVLLSVAGKNRPNIITLSWVANVCSKPPTVVVGIRPERHSHDMVREAGDFVLNIPSTKELEACKFAGTKSGREYDKFETCNLTPIPSSKVKSPMIEECPINVECKVRHVQNLGAHDLFIAEVVAVHLDKSILDTRESFDPSKMDLLTYLPLSGQYWSLGERLS